ncbi:MAG TPA: hypothetical protein VJ302_29175 [Blastocatellia bacterium]|nr:hypothetical protein [Blastocatellia bacterium]
MDLFGLTLNRVAARIDQHGKAPAVPGLGLSLLVGSLGFCLSSLVVFATVAYAERWMYRNLGLTGAYLVWIILFILLGGAILSPLVIGPDKWWRFQLLFGAAFLLYSIGWTASYFGLPRASGAWVGSLAGSVLMALVIAVAFGSARTVFALTAMLFIANSAGYFLGESFAYSIRGKTGMMLWGTLYGLGLGAGLGASLFVVQAPIRNYLSKRTPQ